MKKSATARAVFALCRVVVVGDTCVSEEGMASIVGRDKRYHVCGGAHGFYDAGELIRKHQPDVLLIEPFLQDRDGIRWIKDLATEFPRIRILIVSRQSGTDLCGARPTSRRGRLLDEKRVSQRTIARG